MRTLEEFDYEEIYSLQGYEAALKSIVSTSVEELKAGVDPATALLRFHSKASNLRRLNEADRRRDPPKRRKRNGKEKTEEKKSKA